MDAVDDILDDLERRRARRQRGIDRFRLGAKRLEPWSPHEVMGEQVAEMLRELNHEELTEADT